MILLDSNVLLRLPDKMSPQRPIARQAILSLHRRNEILVIVPQNLYEFWAVSTRPSGRPNGMGMPAERSELWLNYLQRTFNLLPETEAFERTTTVGPFSTRRSRRAMSKLAGRRDWSAAQLKRPGRTLSE